MRRIITRTSMVYTGADTFFEIYQIHPVSIYTYPQSFTTMALFKSLHAGILWPVLPIRVATGPKEFFVLGYSAKKAFDEIETEIQKQAEV